MISIATRLNNIGEYYFSQKLRQIEELNKQGQDIINLGIGSPDLPPHPDVIATLAAAAEKPNVHAYQSYKGSPVLRNAIADWYRTWYQVTLDPETAILPLIGSKEGIMHICMTYLNPGDEALVPNPGYPTYRSAVQLAGATCVEYSLLEENNYEPDLNTLNNRSGKVKLMFLNYPNMPTGQLPAADLFPRLVRWAKANNVLLVHDNPYSFILNDQPQSLMAVEGAMECALELNSLSKSHNMAGWRVGCLVGAKERIAEVLRFKSNMDSGMFLPVQLAAAKALSLPAAWFEQLNQQYRERREKVFELLKLLNCRYSQNQAGMFVWAALPPGEASGYSLSDRVLATARVFITPGGIFGSAGDKYIRISLCSPLEKLDLACKRIKESITEYNAL